MKKILLLILALMLAACGSAHAEFDQNLKKWNDANINHYQYKLFISCFCPFFEDMPLTIEVKGGEVVSITRADGTVVDSSNPSYETYQTYGTIDSLFSKLKTDIAGEADEVVVTYDATYGFPTSIAIDYIKEAVDDELSLQVLEFQILE